MLSTYILLPFCIVVSTLKKKLYRVNCMNGLAAHLCSQTIIFAFEFYKCRLQPKMRIPCKLRALTVKWSLSPFKTIHSPVLILPPHIATHYTDWPPHKNKEDSSCSVVNCSKQVNSRYWEWLMFFQLWLTPESQAMSHALKLTPVSIITN